MEILNENITSDYQDPLSLANQHIKLIVVDQNSINNQLATNVFYRCVECPKICISKRDLRRHSFVHIKEKNFECDICLKKFKSLNILKTHQRRHTIDDRTYECQICLEKFPNDYLYKNHITKKTHVESCTECDSKFHNKKDLDTHVFKHHTNVKYRCHVCKEEKNDNVTLLKHVEETHELSKTDFQCDYCGKYALTKPSLTKHITLNHKKLPGVICEICGYKALYANRLKKHMYKHTLIKPDLCTICGKSFARETLKIHMLVHTGEKPHKCEYCSKRFTQHSALKIHIRSHTGEKPHKCDICQKCFATTHSLKHHKKVKHNVI